MNDGSLRSVERQDTTARPLRAIVSELVGTVARKALDGLFPWSCAACDGPAETALCADCLAGSRWISEPICPRCGLPLASPPSHLCGRCLSEPPSFSRLRALVAYRSDDEANEPIGKLVRALKYARRRAIAGTLSCVLADRLPFAADSFDVLVPVPLHLDRLRERGFNQAALLARETARRFDITLDVRLLERIRPTPPQVGLGRQERRRNLRRAFGVRPGHSAAGLRVLVVDDVCTSGATADACAEALLESGAKSVDVVALARALPH